MNLFNCCTPKEINSIKNKDLIVAEFEDDKLLEYQLDSMISDMVYQVKLNAINEYFSNLLLDKESKNNNLSRFDYVNATKLEDNDPYLKIELANNSYTNIVKTDSIKANIIYKKAVYQAKIKGLRNNILENNRISISLEKDFHRDFNKKLEGPFLYKSNTGCCVEIIIVSNYECSYCYKMHNELKELVNEYKDIAQFKFVYLSNNLLKFSKAPIAANLQNSFDEMNEFVFEKVKEGTINDSLIIDYAKKLNLNINKFVEDYNSVKIHNQMLDNNDILKDHFIYQTPTLIINNKIYDEPNVINILKNILKNKKIL